MDLPAYDTLNLLLVFSVTLSFVSVFLILVLYFKIRRSHLQEEKLSAEAKKQNAELAKKIEEIAKDQIDEIMRTVSGNLGAGVKKQIDDFSRVATKKATEISEFTLKQQQQQIKESQFFVANMLSKIEKDAEQYRANKLLKVDEEIRQVILSAAREVIGRSISLSEHEDLVTKAVEKAKKEKIFI